MKLGMKTIPLEAIPHFYFLISYQQ